MCDRHWQYSCLLHMKWALKWTILLPSILEPNFNIYSLVTYILLLKIFSAKLLFIFKNLIRISMVYTWYVGRGCCSLDRNKCARIVTVSTREYIWNAFVFPFANSAVVFHRLHAHFEQDILHVLRSHSACKFHECVHVRPPLTIFVFASHEMSIEMNKLIDFNPYGWGLESGKMRGFPEHLPRFVPNTYIELYVKSMHCYCLYTAIIWNEHWNEQSYWLQS
jgi:hypothetical protein